MRIIHTSDTHLGHQQYPRTDGEGLNQREQDHAKAFHAVIDAAIAAKADLFVHAGDLFDGVRPSNRALATAQDGFLKLSRAGIPTVLIAGNHEHPKLRETGSALRLFSSIPGMHVAYQGRRETYIFQYGATQIRVHAVPQCVDNQALAQEIAAIPKPDSGLDILVVHGAVSTLKSFSHAEFNEQSLEASWFDARFDYVALGHYHGVQQVAPNAWYCGAPERVSLAESGQEKGFLDVRLEPGKPAQATFVPLPIRPYVDLPPLDAAGLDAEAVLQVGRASIAPLPSGAVARLRIQNAHPNLRSSLDVRALHEAGKHLLHLDLSRIEWSQAEHATDGAADFGSLADEFASFAARTPMEGVEREKVLALARSVLQAGAS